MSSCLELTDYSATVEGLSSPVRGDRDKHVLPPRGDDIIYLNRIMVMVEMRVFPF